MSTRTIISIDQERCTGCGLCIPNCPEGALQVIDGTARLVSDLFCDGLGACVGYCPEGAITTMEREAVPYDERRVMENIIPQGANTIGAHLRHLEAHGQAAFLQEALAALRDRGVPEPLEWRNAAEEEERPLRFGAVAPAAAASAPRSASPTAAAEAVSALGNWPIQLHLLSPTAPTLRGRDVLLSADCVAHAVADFHRRLLAGTALAIACPKLDEGREIYQDKITAMVDHAQIASLTVAMMEVPCCRGLLAMAQAAIARAHRSVPLKAIIVSIGDGKILAEQTVAPAERRAP